MSLLFANSLVSATYLRCDPSQVQSGILYLASLAGYSYYYEPICMMVGTSDSDLQIVESTQLS